MVAFILVHGTFATHASWVKNGSPIRQTLEAISTHCGQLAKFEVVKWSGKNRGVDRIKASAEIARLTEKITHSEPGEPIILIGHSHGGSALAYFLKAFPDLRPSIKGCIFLSTPFVAMRLRPQASALARAIGAALGVILFFVTTALVGYFCWKFKLERGVAVSLISFSFLFGSAAAIAVWTRGSSWLKRSIEVDAFKNRISDTQTANLPQASFLFVRASGDEAAALLSASQFVSWCMSNLAGLASAVVVFAARELLRINKSGWGRVLLMISAVILTVWFLAITLIRLEFHSWTWGDFVGRGWDIGTGYPVVDKFASYLVLLLSPFFVALVLGSFAYSFLMLSSLTVGAVALRLFGWMSIKEAIFTDFSVEPLPYGHYDLIHIDWSEQSPDEIGLNHSRTYLNPVALDQIAKFVSSTLRRV
ncbi:lipase family alpha/beta hydrolase [Bradyrhizobium sp. 2TAF36]|uniref:lipase family alpha/beta hydrolase n=1 Tax=Bradyrhizobium sp. 2TAF36 TaxID=3233016 RepID=UPI003F913265